MMNDWHQLKSIIRETVRQVVRAELEKAMAAQKAELLEMMEQIFDRPNFQVESSSDNFYSDNRGQFTSMLSQLSDAMEEEEQTHDPALELEDTISFFTADTEVSFLEDQSLDLNFESEMPLDLSPNVSPAQDLEEDLEEATAQNLEEDLELSIISKTNSVPNLVSDSVLNLETIATTDLAPDLVITTQAQDQAEDTQFSDLPTAWALDDSVTEPEAIASNEPDVELFQPDTSLALFMDSPEVIAIPATVEASPDREEAIILENPEPAIDFTPDAQILDLSTLEQKREELLQQLAQLEKQETGLGELVVTTGLDEFSQATGTLEFSSEEVKAENLEPVTQIDLITTVPSTSDLDFNAPQNLENLSGLENLEDSGNLEGLDPPIALAPNLVTDISDWAIVSDPTTQISIDFVPQVRSDEVSNEVPNKIEVRREALYEVVGEVLSENLTEILSEVSNTEVSNENVTEVLSELQREVVGEFSSEEVSSENLTEVLTEVFNKEVSSENVTEVLLKEVENEVTDENQSSNASSEFVPQIDQAEQNAQKEASQEAIAIPEPSYNPHNPWFLGIDCYEKFLSIALTDSLTRRTYTLQFASTNRSHSLPLGEDWQLDQCWDTTIPQVLQNSYEQKVQTILTKVVTDLRHPQLPTEDIPIIFQNLRGIIVSLPIAQSTAYGVKFRQAILQAGWTTSPESILVIDRAIAPLLAIMEQQRGFKNIYHLSIHCTDTYTTIALSLKPLAFVNLPYGHQFVENTFNQAIMQNVFSHISERETVTYLTNICRAHFQDPSHQKWEYEWQNQRIPVDRSQLDQCQQLALRQWLELVAPHINQFLSQLPDDTPALIWLMGRLPIGFWEWLSGKLAPARPKILHEQAIVEGLATAPFWRKYLDIVKLQYSDYFLIHEICALRLPDPCTFNTISDALHQRGVNVRACLDRLQQLITKGIPAHLGLGFDARGSQLFQATPDGKLSACRNNMLMIRSHLQQLQYGLRQNLAEPLVFPYYP